MGRAGSLPGRQAFKSFLNDMLKRLTIPLPRQKLNQVIGSLYAPALSLLLHPVGDHHRLKSLKGTGAKGKELCRDDVFEFLYPEYAIFVVFQVGNAAFQVLSLPGAPEHLRFDEE